MLRLTLFVLLCAAASHASCLRNEWPRAEIVCHYRGDLNVAFLDPCKCTVLVVNAVTVDQFLVVQSSLDFSEITGLKAKNPYLKVVLSVGGDNIPAETFVSAVSSVEALTNFTEGITNFVSQNSLDGIEVDWRWPGAPRGIKSKDQLTTLVKVLRLGLDKQVLNVSRRSAGEPDSGPSGSLSDLLRNETEGSVQMSTVKAILDQVTTVSPLILHTPEPVFPEEFYDLEDSTPAGDRQGSDYLLLDDYSADEEDAAARIAHEEQGDQIGLQGGLEAGNASGGERDAIMATADARGRGEGEGEGAAPATKVDRGKIKFKDNFKTSNLDVLMKEASRQGGNGQRGGWRVANKRLIGPAGRIIRPLEKRIGNGKILMLSVSPRPEYIVKGYDLKELARIVDMFTVPADNLTSSFNPTGQSSDVITTYHHARLMGVSDIHNADSLIDLIVSMGVPLDRLVLGVPSSASVFTLKDESDNLPRSPATSPPLWVPYRKLCSLLSSSTNWTIERDEDLTGSFAFLNATWIAFDDPVALRIKAKYSLLRELAGIGIHSIDDDDWMGRCSQGPYPILTSVYDTFTQLSRTPRKSVLRSLVRDLETGDSSLRLSQLGGSSDLRISPYRIVRIVDRTGAITALRSNTDTKYECSRQGYYRDPDDCSQFYRCVKFDQYIDEYTVFEYSCPIGLVFDDRWEICAWPSTASPCDGSSEIFPVPRNENICNEEGYFTDPENCRWFFACRDYYGNNTFTLYEFRCPFGLAYDEEKKICNWPWLVSSCGEYDARLSDRGTGKAIISDVSYGQDVDESSGQKECLNCDNAAITINGNGVYHPEKGIIVAASYFNQPKKESNSDFKQQKSSTVGQSFLRGSTGNIASSEELKDVKEFQADNNKNSNRGSTTFDRSDNQYNIGKGRSITNTDNSGESQDKLLNKYEQNADPHSSVQFNIPGLDIDDIEKSNYEQEYVDSHHISHANSFLTKEQQNTQQTSEEFDTEHPIFVSEDSVPEILSNRYSYNERNHRLETNQESPSGSQVNTGVGHNFNSGGNYNVNRFSPIKPAEHEPKEVINSNSGKINFKAQRSRESSLLNNDRNRKVQIAKGAPRTYSNSKQSDLKDSSISSLGDTTFSVLDNSQDDISYGRKAKISTIPVSSNGRYRTSHSLGKDSSHSTKTKSERTKSTTETIKPSVSIYNSPVASKSKAIEGHEPSVKITSTNNAHDTVSSKDKLGNYQGLSVDINPNSQIKTHDRTRLRPSRVKTPVIQHFIENDPTYEQFPHNTQTGDAISESDDNSKIYSTSHDVLNSKNESEDLKDPSFISISKQTLTNKEQNYNFGRPDAVSDGVLGNRRNLQTNTHRPNYNSHDTSRNTNSGSFHHIALPENIESDSVEDEKKDDNNSNDNKSQVSTSKPNDKYKAPISTSFGSFDSFGINKMAGFDSNLEDDRNPDFNRQKTIDNNSKTFIHKSNNQYEAPISTERYSRVNDDNSGGSLDHFQLSKPGINNNYRNKNSDSSEAKKINVDPVTHFGVSEIRQNSDLKNNQNENLNNHRSKDNYDQFSILGFSGEDPESFVDSRLSRTGERGNFKHTKDEGYSTVKTPNPVLLKTEQTHDLRRNKYVASNTPKYNPNNSQFPNSKTVGVNNHNSGFLELPETTRHTDSQGDNSNDGSYIHNSNINKGAFITSKSPAVKNTNSDLGSHFGISTIKEGGNKNILQSRLSKNHGSVSHLGLSGTRHNNNFGNNKKGESYTNRENQKGIQFSNSRSTGVKKQNSDLTGHLKVVGTGDSDNTRNSQKGDTYTHGSNKERSHFSRDSTSRLSGLKSKTFGSVSHFELPETRNRSNLENVKNDGSYTHKPNDKNEHLYKSIVPAVKDKNYSSFAHKLSGTDESSESYDHRKVGLVAENKQDSQNDDSYTQKFKENSRQSSSSGVKSRNSGSATHFELPETTHNGYLKENINDGTYTHTSNGNKFSTSKLPGANRQNFDSVHQFGSSISTNNGDLKNSKNVEHSRIENPHSVSNTHFRVVKNDQNDDFRSQNQGAYTNKNDKKNLQSANSQSIGVKNQTSDSLSHFSLSGPGRTLDSEDNKSDYLDTHKSNEKSYHFSTPGVSGVNKKNSNPADHSKILDTGHNTDLGNNNNDGLYSHKDNKNNRQFSNSRSSGVKNKNLGSVSHFQLSGNQHHGDLRDTNNNGGSYNHRFNGKANSKLSEVNIKHSGSLGHFGLSTTGNGDDSENDKSGHTYKQRFNKGTTQLPNTKTSRVNNQHSGSTDYLGFAGTEDSDESGYNKNDGAYNTRSNEKSNQSSKSKLTKVDNQNSGFEAHFGATGNQYRENLGDNRNDGSYPSQNNGRNTQFSNSKLYTPKEQNSGSLGHFGLSKTKSSDDLVDSQNDDSHPYKFNNKNSHFSTSGLSGLKKENSDSVGHFALSGTTERSNLRHNKNDGSYNQKSNENNRHLLNSQSKSASSGLQNSRNYQIKSNENNKQHSASKPDNKYSSRSSSSLGIRNKNSDSSDHFSLPESGSHTELQNNKNIGYSNHESNENTNSFSTSRHAQANENKSRPNNYSGLLESNKHFESSSHKKTTHRNIENDDALNIGDISRGSTKAKSSHNTPSTSRKIYNNNHNNNNKNYNNNYNNNNRNNNRNNNNNRNDKDNDGNYNSNYNERHNTNNNYNSKNSQLSNHFGNTGSLNTNQNKDKLQGKSINPRNESGHPFLTNNNKNGVSIRKPSFNGPSLLTKLGNKPKPEKFGIGGVRSIYDELEPGVCERAGLFRHPDSCDKFYECYWDRWLGKFTLHIFNCPVTIVYDSGITACNWPFNGPICTDDKYSDDD